MNALVRNYSYFFHILLDPALSPAQTNTVCALLPVFIYLFIFIIFYIFISTLIYIVFTMIGSERVNLIYIIFTDDD